MGFVSWSMFKTCAAVLKSRPTLALFPVLAAGACLVVMLLIAAFMTTMDTSVDTLSAAYFICAIAFLVVAAAVTILSRAALISQADVALRGGVPSLTAGVRAVLGKWKRLALCAIGGTPVLRLRGVLRDRESRARALVETANSQVVSYLVLPMIVLTDHSVADAAQESSAALKRNCGENVVSTTGLVPVTVLLTAPGVVVFFASGLLVPISTTLALIVMALALLWLLLTAVVVITLSAIHRTALYHFAVDGRTPAAFAHTDISRSFRRI